MAGSGDHAEQNADATYQRILKTHLGFSGIEEHELESNGLEPTKFVCFGASCNITCQSCAESYISVPMWLNTTIIQWGSPKNGMYSNHKQCFSLQKLKRFLLVPQSTALTISIYIYNYIYIYAALPGPLHPPPERVWVYRYRAKRLCSSPPPVGGE